MKKQYIIPLGVRIPEGDLPSILAATQSPWADAKSGQFSEEEDSQEENGLWNLEEQKHYSPWD
ncbi:MAG: hypothetical protein MR709_09015 [Bacteroidales bacterium]|nr:hypothetical protein [Bacteroidales bacterium]